MSGGSVVRNSSANAPGLDLILELGGPLEKDMTIALVFSAWEIQAIAKPPTGHTNVYTYAHSHPLILGNLGVAVATRLISRLNSVMV